MTHQQDERGDPITRTHDPARKDYSARETRQGGREGRADESGTDKRGKAGGDETGGKRQGTRGMKRCGKDAGEQPEAGEQQRAAGRQEDERQVDCPGQ